MHSVEKTPFLRKLSPADTDALWQLVQDNYDHPSPFICEVLETYPSREAVCTRLNAFMEEPARLDLGIMVESQLAGHIHLRPLSERIAIVGYWLAKQYIGRGLAKKAVGQAIDLTFSERNQDQLVAYADSDNLASRRVLESTGFGLTAVVAYPNLPNQKFAWYKIKKA